MQNAQGRIAYAVLAGLAGLAASAVGEDASHTATDDAPGVRVDLPHAGVSLTLPPGYATVAPEEASGLLRAAPDSEYASPVGISLSAVWTPEAVTTAACADRMLAELRENIDFRDVQRLTRAEARIAGRPGVLEVLSYVARGEATVAMRGLWLRELPDAPDVCYVLSVETLADNRSALVSVFRPLLKSLRMSELRSPTTLPVRSCGAAVTDLELGYRLEVPLGWYVARRYGGAVLAQTDYLAGGMPARRASVTVARGRADETADSFFDLAARRAERLYGVEMATVSSEATELDGRAAKQRVLQVADGTASEGAAGNATVVHRVALVGEGAARRGYSLTVMARTDDVEAAKRVADGVAGGFVFVERGAATRPAED
ncbi:MAG: hypothetical protein ACOC8F_05840 [Planctomycetota bacterium]